MSGMRRTPVAVPTVAAVTAAAPALPPRCPAVRLPSLPAREDAPVTVDVPRRN
ncbi:hypothetical protein [Streptomyces sp. NPDC086519]|uniref:hypothetical protein n=1 Tax=Streptomyces sp. NPDC086519 TaxID=3154863 RepID=UPI003431C8DC